MNVSFVTYPYEMQTCLAFDVYILLVIQKEKYKCAKHKGLMIKFELCMYRKKHEINLKRENL